MFLCCDMEALTSAEPTLKWFWIIEYLTTLHQVGVRVLNDLVDAAPPFPADLKSKIDELIALRTLEEMCEAGDKSAAGTGDLANKVGIDLSETCLNVLNCILKEASISDIITRTKLLQFDIRPFILHKRATMPKSALQQMFSEKQFVNNQDPIKETISRAFIRQMPKKPVHKPNFASLNNDLEGGSSSKECFPIYTECFAHEDQQGRGDADFLLPNAKKLKQTVPNTSETELSVPNPFERENSAAVPDEGAGIFEGDELGNEASLTVANGNSHSDSLKSGSRVLGGDSIRSSVLPLKKRLFGSNWEYSGNLPENLQECEQNREDPDLRPNAKKLRRSALEPEVESAVVNVNGRADAEIVGGETTEENPVNCVKPREISDSGSKHQNFVQKSTIDGFLENARNNLSADGLQHKEDIVEHNTVFDLDMNMEQIADKDPTSSRDEINVTLKTMESLSSKEQKVCVKCKQGSQLSVCQMEDCALVVHAKCLGLEEGLCVFGNFYCPSCAYADAEKEYGKAEMEASLLRADLGSFLCSGFEVDIANIWAQGQNLAGNDQNELDNSKKGVNQEICEEKVLEDEVTNPEGMNLSQDHGNGGSSHEDHEEHLGEHSEADGGVCVSEEHVVLIEDSVEGTKEDEIYSIILATDEAKTKEEALDDLHEDHGNEGSRGEDHEGQNLAGNDQNELDNSKNGGNQEICEDEVTNPEGMNLDHDHGNGGSKHEDHDGQNLAGNDQDELDNSKKGGNQEICEEKVLEDEVTNPEGMNLSQDHGNGGSSHEDHEEHLGEQSDSDDGVCVSEEHVSLIKDSGEGTKEDDLHADVIEDEVTNPEGMNLSQDHGNGGSSHEDHEEHLGEHSDSDDGVCVIEEHVSLIEDSGEGTEEDDLHADVIEDEVTNPEGMDLSQDHGSGGSSHEDHEEHLGEHSDSDDGVCVSEEHVSLIEDSGEGTKEDDLHADVIEDEVTNPEGMNLSQDHGNGGSSHEDHEEHLGEHSDSDDGVCVIEEHVSLIEDSGEGTEEDDLHADVIEDEVTNPEGMNLSQDHGSGGSSHEDHEEHLGEHSDSDDGVCVSEEHVSLIEDSGEGTKEDDLHADVIEDEVTNPEGMNLSQDHGSGGSSHEDHEEHLGEHSDSDDGVCVSEEHVSLIEDSGEGTKEDDLHADVIEDEVTNPEGMNLSQDHGSGGSSHEDHEEHLGEHSDSDDGVCVSEEHVSLIEDSGEGTKEDDLHADVIEDEVTNPEGMNLSQDHGNGGSSHEYHEEHLGEHSDSDDGVCVSEEHVSLIEDSGEGTEEDDLHADGYSTPEHEHENQLSDESPGSPSEEEAKKQETKVTTPWKKLISFGSSIFMAGLGGSDQKKK